MGFLRQTWTLTRKNLKIVLWRHWISTILRAVLLPIVFMFFISYAKNFFVPPSKYGIGSATPVRSFTDSLHAASDSHSKVVFVTNGHTGGDIYRVISQLAPTVRAAGKQVVTVDNDLDLLTACRSSLRGASACYGAASFHSSPSEGPGGFWNYSLRADGVLGEKIFVDQKDNDQEVYVLPFQRAIDVAIASSNGTTLPETVDEYPFTSETAQERADNIRRLYMGALIDILAVAFWLGITGIAYQLTGFMALERELGISQLIESMTPSRHTQMSRLISTHLAFDIIYLPSWIVMSIIVYYLVFPTTSFGVVFVLHLLAGLALASFSILGASFFHKAQLSGIIVTITTIVLAIIAQVAGPFSTGAVVILSLIFPSMNYTFFIIHIARFERVDRPASLTHGAPNNSFSLPGIVFWIFSIIQIFVYPILGAFVERTLYGTASKARNLTLTPSDSSVSVKIDSFCKTYRPSWWQRRIMPFFGVKPRETVLAVNNLSLEALRGQVMVLLGANGSGKSTTLDAISGLNSVDGGTIEVDGTGGLGYCPQKNVMWDQLTVYEHVAIFNKLKSTGKTATKEEIYELLRACDLEHKINAKSKTLSGGQKRKLQLAMMFIGGSRVCCVDEVSSGVDPLSRRKLWDILLAERGKRTLLFTTHFLDEADILSDHIAILSKGNLVANGSAVELKHKFGGGYHVVIYHENGQPVRLSGFGNVPRKLLFDHTVYQLTDSTQATHFVAGLEKEGLREYQVNGPTIEDVFLKLAQEVKAEEPTTSRSEIPVVVREHVTSKHLGDKSGTPTNSDITLDSDDKGVQLNLLPGKGTSMLKQARILFTKRFIILRRNYVPYALALLVPLTTAGLVTFFLKGFHALSCDPGNSSSNPSVAALAFAPDLDIPIGPSSRITPGALALLTRQNTSNFHLVESLDDFNTYVRRNYANVTPGGFFLGDTPTFAYIGNWNIYFSVMTQNVLDTVLAQVPITTQFQSFAVPFAPGAGKTLQLVLYFGLAMSAYPGFFALYPTAERLRKVRALHYSNGIRAAPLWLAYLTFDFLLVLLISALVTIIFVSVSSIWYAPGYLFVVFFLYGLASALYSYVISLFTTSQLAAFAFAAGGQAVCFLIAFILYMTILTYSPADQIDHQINLSYFIWAIVSPSASLLRALLLSLNEFSILCRGGTSIPSYPGGMTVYGGPITYLVIQSILLFIFLVWTDSGYRPGFLSRSKVHSSDTESTHSVDAAVAAEISRTETSLDDPLRVLHLSKFFGSNHAVQDVTLGIKRNEVFALLGPNGAGKSTTISLIRGDIHPSGRNCGDVLVEDISIIKSRPSARAHLGVCPQFDAMDTMTVIEHLRFYAKARGVVDIDHNVSAIIQAVGLEPFKHRLAAELSGGNKRKLSLGIALTGNPSVLLLDEPSSGMDAASKRVMWKTLDAVTGGRCLLITTHSMEEADALAGRAGIMAGHMLAVGTTAELRSKYGDGLGVHLVMKSAPHTSDEEMGKVRAWVQETIPGAVVENRSFHGQLRFRVPNGIKMIDGQRQGAQGISALFALLEEHKEVLGFEYYSVSQATLDQVFLRIVGEHNVLEEGARREKKSGLVNRVRKMLRNG